MIDEGYIKYRCAWINTDVVAHGSVADMTYYRDALYQLNLIGVLDSGIGFGNISQRVSSATESPQFNISGTQTGALSTLLSSDYALVTDFNPKKNSLTCKGLRKASSESLTHGVVYSSDPTIGAIIHVHHSQMWKRLLDQVPTTRPEVSYGTPEMAEETQRLFQKSNLAKLKIFAMAGHEDGIVTFGETLEVAYRVLIIWGLRTGLFTQAESDAALHLPYQLKSQKVDRSAQSLLIA